MNNRSLVFGFALAASFASSAALADCSNGVASIFRDACSRSTDGDEGESRSERRERFAREREEARELADAKREARELASTKRAQDDAKTNEFCVPGNPLCQTGQYYGPRLPPRPRDVPLADYPVDPYEHRFTKQYQNATPENRAKTDYQVEDQLQMRRQLGIPFPGGSTLSKPDSGVSGGKTPSPSLKK